MKKLIILNIVLSLIYLSWWFQWDNISNVWLYGLLLVGEIYHVFTAWLFWFTSWPGGRKYNLFNGTITPPVDIFITVAGEPIEVVEETVIAAKNIAYPSKNIYILNDSFVAKKKNWREYEELASRVGIHCITRRIPGGAKAGNINNALNLTKSELVVIFDADMVPHSDFLKETVGYFADQKVGFVQTPQYYKNWEENEVTAGAWEQQKLFFGPIMEGKDRKNAAFICGTNVIIRRSAILEAGGMNEKNIAEDFMTSLTIHQKGWKSVYVNKVLAEGLAPQDLLSYFKQQLRWSRGSLEVLFAHNPFLKRGLSISQRLEYLSSGLFYFNGVIVVIDMIMPLLFLYLGWQPVASTTTNFAIYFFPYITAILYTLYLVAGNEVTFRAISFNHSNWMLQVRALFSVLTGQKMGFSVTPKNAQQGKFLYLIYPHLLYIGLTIAGGVSGILREGLDPSVVTNLAWALFNVVLFLPFVRAAIQMDTLFNKSKSNAASYQVTTN
jgi:cellulose synthase (UDP-forming)